MHKVRNNELSKSTTSMFNNNNNYNNNNNNNERVKILWYFNIQTDREIKHRSQPGAEEICLYIICFV